MDRDKINARFFPPDRLIVADVAIVLGGNDAQRPAEHAAKIYRNGHARKLLFTGGFNARLRATEAEAMAASARVAGVPDDAILVEPRAKNTDENLQFAQELIVAPSAILLVTIHFHLARALVAARKHFPDPVDIGWTCYPSRYYASADWEKSTRGRADVHAEMRKIALYYGVVPDEVR